MAIPPWKMASRGVCLTGLIRNSLLPLQVSVPDVLTAHSSVPGDSPNTRIIKETFLKNGNALALP